MKILLAEYSVCTGMEGAIQKEGRAMLNTLKSSFEKAGCSVLIPDDFEDDLERQSRECDCGLVIAPDDILEGYTKVIEENCINLGCPSSVIRLCADKLETTETLIHNGIPAPRIVREEGVKCVVKPRYGCASEGVYLSESPSEKEGCISTEYIEGDHMSVSLIGGSTMLPLTLNRQFIDFKDTIEYNGNETPYAHPGKDEIFSIAMKAGHMLGCRGLFGVDIVYGDKPYVVDVNPRPTTAVLCISRVMDENIADLILRARFGILPKKVNVTGHCSFTKRDLENLR
ncbi:peptidase [Methanocella sp. CWC-04]|uniref:Peptidase n=1 Tax=Methanooceanicella nereidis TaxID=2052831 RepID=A0AAP2RAX0_9EURY|nr:ATP-grasp domain-containing protein [Methanocella sp. CWC-04]MCD1293662.1 peptidase [Methanocella sp. CWC-04]